VFLEELREEGRNEARLEKEYVNRDANDPKKKDQGT